MALIGMDTSCTINLIETLHLDYGLTMPQSLILLSAGVRLVQIPAMAHLFRRFSNVDSQLFDSSIFKKLVLNDLKRDLPKLEGDRGLRYWKDFYSASNMLSCLFASYS